MAFSIADCAGIVVRVDCVELVVRVVVALEVLSTVDCAGLVIRVVAAEAVVVACGTVDMIIADPENQACSTVQLAE